MFEGSFEGMEYLMNYPEGFSEDQKYPLLIFLHGRGARSKNFDRLKQYKSVEKLQNLQKKRDFIFLAPHCKTGNWNEWMSVLIRLVGDFRERSYVDETRVYLMGNSMGGYGTWELALLRAPWFAAAMPICGGGLPGMANELGTLPIRAFHGLCDSTVDPIESLQMVKAVNNVGGCAELILFPKVSHNCWDLVYADDSNFDWMFSFTNERDKADEK